MHIEGTDVTRALRPDHLRPKDTARELEVADEVILRIRNRQWHPGLAQTPTAVHELSEVPTSKDVSNLELGSYDAVAPNTDL
jgi:hypothetical protein